MKCKYELLVFDLDGTVIDSKKDICVAVNWAFEQAGEAPLDESIIEQYVGTGVQALFSEKFYEKGSSSYDFAIGKFKDYYAANSVVYTSLYDGVLEVFEEFRNVKKLILTNKSNLFVQPILDHFQITEHFEGVFGRDSFPTRKPDPGPLLEIAKQWQTNTSNILMIGDTDADILAGKNSGSHTCAVLYGFGNEHDLVSLNPTHIAKKPNDLIHLIG